MGTEYTLYKHTDSTLFELGKGPWSLLQIETLFDGAALYAFLMKQWDTFEETPAKCGYFKLLTDDLVSFVQGAKPTELCLSGDGSDDFIYAGVLGYTCVGSRYDLPHPVNNPEAIKAENEALRRNSNYDLSAFELDYLKSKGWNFSKCGLSIAVMRHPSKVNHTGSIPVVRF